MRTAFNKYFEERFNEPEFAEACDQARKEILTVDAAVNYLSDSITDGYRLRTIARYLVACADKKDAESTLKARYWK